MTSIHSHLPPKSGCRNHIPRFALSRRRATALFRNPVCKAQRSVPGFSSTPNSACRRYATSPPSIGLRIPFVRHHPSDCPIGAIHRHRRKTAEERFHTLARGWLAYPVTPMHAHLPPKSGCINVIPAKRISEMRHTQRAEPPFPGSPALRLNQLLFSYSITFCALPSTTTTYTPLSRRTSPMPRNANCPATV